MSTTLRTPPLERILARKTPRGVLEVAYKQDPTRPLGGPKQPGSIRNRLRVTVSNMPLRVPRSDWERVVIGEKTIFRAWATEGTNRHAPSFPPGTEFPRPVLVYSQAGDGRARSAKAPADVRVMIVTGFRHEPLGAISPQDIEREGFKSLNAFRLYWKARHPKIGWRPDALVNVVEIRPFEHDDYEMMGHWALTQLFGEHL